MEKSKTCPFCSKHMYLRRRKPVHFQENNIYDCYVDHQLWKCSNCSFAATFDTPVSRAEFEQQRAQGESNNTVYQRLKKLGYIKD